MVQCCLFKGLNGWCLFTLTLSSMRLKMPQSWLKPTYLGYLSCPLLSRYLPVLPNLYEDEVGINEVSWTPSSSSPRFGRTRHVVVLKTTKIMVFEINRPLIIGVIAYHYEKSINHWSPLLLTSRWTPLSTSICFSWWAIRASFISKSARCSVIICM